MKSRRVVVTGLGVISSIGFGASKFAQALRQGSNGISEISIFDTEGFPSKRGGEVKGFEPHHWITTLNPTSLGRSSQFAVAAARLAVEDAGMPLDMLSQSRCGVCVGTTEGESQATDQIYEKWVQEGPEYLDPLVIAHSTADRLAISVALELNLHGEALTLSNACSAGNYAIGHAYDLISSGDADYMLCGGSDSMGRKTFAGFHRYGAVAPEECQPFDQDRKGMMTAEGSGMMLLEDLDHAMARSAPIYAEVLGYGLNCDAKHVVAPDQDSIANCIRIAHQNAGIRPEEVDYISGHGTGTKANDLAESSAIRQVFLDQAPPTSSIKSMIGHAMGAASALSAIACVIALKEGFIPPTANVKVPDPECGLDCVPEKARPTQLNIVQNNGFAFGGNNAIVVLSRWCHQRN